MSSIVKGTLVCCLLTLATAVPGCYTTQIVDAEFLGFSNDRDIVVSVDSGINYSFASKEYNLVELSDGKKAIRGRGKKFRDNGPQFLNFDGDVLMESVQKVTIHDKSIFYYTPIYILGTAVVLGIALGLALNGRGFGG